MMFQTDTPGGVELRSVPERAPLVLATLILVAGVANLNLSVANVALPSIGKAFDYWAYTAGVVAVLLGAALVFFVFFFPHKDAEQQLLRDYQAEDSRAVGQRSASASGL